MSPFSLAFWIPIGAALACGTIIGLDRQFRGKPCGIRTSILICLSTQTFIRLGDVFSGGHADSSRVLGQIVTGVGFLGAGVIMTRAGSVTGVTTAAVIWILAAAGAAIGFGAYWAAMALSLVTVGVLTGVELLEKSLRLFQKGVHLRDTDDHERL